MGWDAPTPEWIWSVSPLDYAAASRIIRSAEVPLASEPDFESLCVTLAALALMMLDVALERPAPASLTMVVAKSFTELTSAMTQARNYSGAPPAIPLDWAQAMLTWMGELIEHSQETPRRGRGAPVKATDHFIYPKLLGFYSLAYGRPPAATQAGPTDRFLRAFLDTMAKVMKTAKWDGGDAASLPDLGKMFVSPTPSALQKKIRVFQDQTEQDLVEAVMAQIAEAQDSGLLLH